MDNDTVVNQGVDVNDISDTAEEQNNEQIVNDNVENQEQDQGIDGKDQEQDQKQDAKTDKLANQRVPYARMKEREEKLKREYESKIQALLQEKQNVQNLQVNKPESNENPLLRGIELPKFKAEYEKPEDYFNDFFNALTTSLPQMIKNHLEDLENEYNSKQSEVETQRQQIQEEVNDVLDSISTELNNKDHFMALLDILEKENVQSPQEIERFYKFYKTTLANNNNKNVSNQKKIAKKVSNGNSLGSPAKASLDSLLNADFESNIFNN